MVSILKNKNNNKKDLHLHLDLHLILTLLLALAVCIVVIWYFKVQIGKNENFASSMTSSDGTDDKDIYKNLKVTRVEPSARMNILPGHCTILINIGNELDRDSRDNFIASFQTELNKVIRSFGNIPIIGQNRITLNLKNESSSTTERLFKGYKIKILDIIVGNNSSISDSSNTTNIINDLQTCIYVMTARDTYKIEGVISSSITPYDNVKKIIKFLGIQTDY